jgi:DNA primase
VNKIDKIKNSIDIVEIIQEYVELTKKGKNYWGICPFHDDSNPSMSVSPEKQLYKCFSCDNGGGVFKFVQQIDKVSFKEAVNIVGKKIGIQIDIKDNIKKYNKNQEKIIKVLNDAMDFYIISIETKEGHHALEYAKKRNLDAKIREKFKIGYAPKNNNLTKFLTNKKKYDIALLMNASLTTSKENDFLNDKLIFGIQNEYGDIIALSGRTLYNDEPKYMNSAETNVFKKNNVLYN